LLIKGVGAGVLLKELFKMILNCHAEKNIYSGGKGFYIHREILSKNIVNKVQKKI